MREMNDSDILVMYMRISVEDKECSVEEKKESNSITNQRSLLRDYIGKSEELTKYLIIEICDDGYSGTNLERPGMKHLLEMVKGQRVACIIVKDFSRFGRDYLLVSDYIDQIFPFMGIRFISVNDHYDSATCKGVTSGIDMAFRNMLYGYYSHDLSLKVKSAKRTKAENGDFLGSFAPLGYQKMPQNKNQLVIEPEGAAVVRKIFELAGTGMSALQITRWLNQEHIPTPCQIKNKQGKFHKGWNGKGKKKIWDGSVVRNILRDERYLGKNVYGKRERIKVGDYHIHITSPEDWIRAKCCHDPIVSKEEFDAARKSIHKCIRKEQKISVTHLFHGKILCGICGHSLRYVRASAPYYCCTIWKSTGGYPCIKENLKENELAETVLFAIRMYMKVLIEKILVEKKMVQEQKSGKREISDLQRSLTVMQANRKDLQECKALLYDRFADGKICREEFQKRQKILTYQQEELQQRYDSLHKELVHLECIINKGEMQEKQLENYSGAGELTRKMVEALIDCIYIYEDKSIHIQWKFGDGGIMG